MFGDGCSLGCCAILSGICLLTLAGDRRRENLKSCIDIFVSCNTVYKPLNDRTNLNDEFYKDVKGTGRGLLLSARTASFRADN